MTCTITYFSISKSLTRAGSKLMTPSMSFSLSRIRLGRSYRGQELGNLIPKPAAVAG